MTGLEQGFEMRFGGLLKPENCFAPVTPVRVATPKQAGFGDPNAVLISAHPNPRQGNDHNR